VKCDKRVLVDSSNGGLISGGEIVDGSQLTDIQDWRHDVQVT
jgi:hypothetical protein